MKKNRSMSIFAAATALLLVVTGSANAVLINVNFEAFTPASAASLPFETESALSGPAGGLNTQWNQFQTPSSTGVVVDSTGAATSVTFTTNFTEGRRASNLNTLPVFRSTLTDFGRAAVRTLTINGLVSGDLYDVWIMAYRDQAPRNLTNPASTEERLSGTWSTNNPTTSPSSQLLDSLQTQSDLVFQDGVNFLLFENVQATGAGTIVFTGAGTIVSQPVSSDDARLGLSAFQIQSVAPAVPEPATASLGLLALSGLMLRRRRAA